MKKSAIISILSLLLILMFVACDKQCHHKWADSEIPPLSDTGYNSCKAVVYNYSFVTESVNKIENFIVPKVKVCGWLMRSDDIYLVGLTDNPSFAGADYLFDNDTEILYCNFGDEPTLFPNMDSIDITKKCYVTGELHLENLPTMSECQQFIPKIYVKDLYFEE